MRGIILFSFAWREQGHSPCNLLLAQAALDIVSSNREDGHRSVIFAQRTTAVALKILEVSPLPLLHIVQEREGYEGSEEVVRQAAKVFREHGVTEVIPVAQPFLHLTKCMQLVRKAGFHTPSFWRLCQMIGWIGFDTKSVQPWTRGPVRLVFYTIRQMLFGYQPPPEFSE